MIAFWWQQCTVYPKKYAHGFCFAVLCCGYTLTDFPKSIRLTSLALWQSNDCPSASKATLMNMDKYVMWIHYERLHNHNKVKHNKTVCIFLGICCMCRHGDRKATVVTSKITPPTLKAIMYQISNAISAGKIATTLQLTTMLPIVTLWNSVYITWEKIYDYQCSP